MRRTTLAATTVAIASTTSLVPSTFTARIVAIAEFGSVVAVLASLAVEAIARPATPVVPPLLARGRAVSGRGNGALGRLIGARLVEVTVPVTPAVPVTLTSGALAFFTRRSFAGRCRRTVGGAFGAAMSLAIMARRTALIGTATRTPDLDQFGLRGRCRCFSRRAAACTRRLRRSFR